MSNLSSLVILLNVLVIRLQLCLLLLRLQKCMAHQHNYFLPYWLCKTCCTEFHQKNWQTVQYSFPALFSCLFFFFFFFFFCVFFFNLFIYFEFLILFKLLNKLSSCIHIKNNSYCTICFASAKWISAIAWKLCRNHDSSL